KRLLKISVWFVIFFYTTKVVFYALSGHYVWMNTGLIALSVTRFHIMIIGCIGAILYYNNSNIISFVTHRLVQLVCWLILVLIILNKFQISSALIDHELVAVITLCVIMAQINRRNYIIDLDKAIFNF